MPLFSRTRKGRDVSNGSLTLPSPVLDEEPQFTATHPNPSREPEPDYGDPWTRLEVEAEEVQELLHICTEEMKSRALDMPLLLLPYRPFFTDINAARMFIRKFFQLSAAARARYHGQSLYHDLKLYEPMVLCSIMKWCWSRLKGGVVTRNTYELFRTGERKSNMAKNAFDTFIPLSVESEARKRIIFDFFDLLAAIAANSKTNGLGGRKLSRLAGWWAFSHSESGRDFDECYKFWARSANATSHLFFAYLRSRAPESKASSGISQLPRSLQTLVLETEYPPEMPLSLETSSSKVAMLVQSFSDSPLALLDRAKALDYYGGSFDLQRLSYQDNLLKALTAECRRVLECISSNKYAASLELDPVSRKRQGPSWSQFEDLGFSSLLDGTASLNAESESKFGSAHKNSSAGIVDKSKTKTPASWSEFLESGFASGPSERVPATLSFPPEQILPPFSSTVSGYGHSMNSQADPPRLAGIVQIELDETFWWVWMTSLSVEEPVNRKAIFGQCAFVETDIIGHRWLVFEERKQEPPPQSEQGEEVDVDVPILHEKKPKFAFGKRSKDRRTASGKVEESLIIPAREEEVANSNIENRSGPDHEQQERVRAAAAALVQQKRDQELAKELKRRGRMDENADSRAASMVTMRPAIARDAGPALQWARKFDKEVIRARYLGDAYAGRGQLREISPNSNAPQIHAYQAKSPPLAKRERELPPLPTQSTTSLGMIEDIPKRLRSASPKRNRVPRKNESERPKTPVDLEATPMTHRSDFSTSLIPSPLMPRRKPVGGSVDLTIRSRTETQELSKNQIPNLNSEDPFGPNSHLDETPADTVVTTEATSGSPTSGSPVLKKSKHGSVRGLRKLFGKRVASEPTKNLAAKRAIFEQNLTAQPQAKLGRKRSFLRRNKDKTEATPPLGTSSPLPSPVEDSHFHHRAPSGHSSIRTLTQVDLEDMQGGEPGPAVTVHSPNAFGMSDQKLHATIPDDMQAVGRAFSNFTQNHTDVDHKGSLSIHSHDPMDSVPNYVGDYQHKPQYGPEAPDSPAPRLRRPSSPPNFTTRAAALLFPAEGQPELEHKLMHNHLSAEPRMEAFPDLIDDDGSSDNVTPEPRVPGAPGNRWAQIRQNAYERRVSEEEAARRGSSSSISKNDRTDEGETSGEECEAIEARVARIKARVAELTGSSPLPGPSLQSRYVRA